MTDASRDDALVEAMARAAVSGIDWDAFEAGRKDHWRKIMRAALAVVREAEGWPVGAIEKMRAEPEIGRRLAVFVDWWGLDAYTPPPDVERNVRDIVAAFLARAHPAPPEGAEP